MVYGFQLIGTHNVWPSVTTNISSLESMYALSAYLLLHFDEESNQSEYAEDTEFVL